jgi:hypothetical protein
LERTSKDLGKA